MAHTIEIIENISGLDTKKIVFKPLSFYELMISLERLSRFQYPHQKKDRVYREIITKNTIVPKISLKKYYDYSSGTIHNLMQLIWNSSVKIHGEESEPDYSINNYLIYENIMAFTSEILVKDIIASNYFNLLNDDKINNNNILNIFNNNGFNISLENSQIKDFDIFSKIYFLYNMNFPLNIDGFLRLAEKQHEKFRISANIQRLTWLNKLAKKEKLDYSKENFFGKVSLIFDKAEKYREEEGAKFPAKLLILTEGATEEKLLPVFADKIGINFDKTGCQLIAAGGKNQVAKIYKKYYQKLNLPILIILDADAVEVAREIGQILCSKDRLFIIQEGEFEDILPVELICRSINAFYRITTQVSPDEIQTDKSMISSLENLWKKKGLGEFDKIKFAQIIAENIKNKADISPVLNQIINIISDLIKDEKNFY